MVFALLAAVCLLQSPDLAADKRLDKLVSYSTTGEAISKSFSEINKTAGITLSVADPFDEEDRLAARQHLPHLIGRNRRREHDCDKSEAHPDHRSLDDLLGVARSLPGGKAVH